MKSNFNNKSGIKVNLLGGIGNQFFGLIFGLAASKFSGILINFDDKYISLGSNKNRKLALNNFVFNNHTQIRISRGFFWKLLCRTFFFRKILIKLNRLFSNIVREKDLDHGFQLCPGQVFDGYFQDWIYADYLFMKEGKFEFDLVNKSETLLNFYQTYKSDDYIFVHVRLGDYIQLSSVYDLLPEEYYLSAIKALKDRAPNTQVIMFCENKSDASKYYPRLSKICSQIIDNKFGLSDSEIFHILSNADKLVVSNSTFSLWPGWFVLNKNGQVIAPSKFKVSGVDSKLIDGRWEKINLDNYKLIKKQDIAQVRQQNAARFIDLFS